MKEKGIFIARVSSLLCERKISQKELARLSGIAESSISRYLAGEMKPRIDIVVNIAKALNVPTAYLLGETELDQTMNSFETTYQMVARNKHKLDESQKLKIIQLLFGK